MKIRLGTIECIVAVSAVILCAPVGTAAVAHATTLSGVVADSGRRPIPGAFVTARNVSMRMSVSVLTDSDGRYSIANLFPGRYELNAHQIGYRSADVKNLRLTQFPEHKSFRLSKTPDIAAQMPASAWLHSLPSGQYKADFLSDCTVCHQIGDAATRGPRTAEQWTAVAQSMIANPFIYGGMTKGVDAKKLGQWLAANGFGPGQAHRFAPPAPAREADARVVITEYDVGGPNVAAHDMAVEPRTGMAWVDDFFADLLVRINPLNNEQKVYRVPIKKSGIHTIAFDRRGMLWGTLLLGDMVVEFDPRTGKFKVYKGFKKGSATHSFPIDRFGYVEFDHQGRLWITELFGNAVASLDPKTGAVKEYHSPSDRGHPYGIAIDNEGRVWYAKYASNIIGMINPENGAITEHELPHKHSCVHRITIDGQDRLWTPDDGYSALVMYDIRKNVFKTYPLPDADSSPYAARVDGATGDIWVNGAGADAIYKFDPATEQFTTYRLPLLVSYTRMVSVDYSTGDVWTSLSNLPNGQTGRDHTEVVRLHFPAYARELGTGRSIANAAHTVSRR